MKSNAAGTTKPREWMHWSPGLDNDGDTLAQVYATLPAHEFGSYPWIVLLLENPKSPVALKGRCTLLRHDLIHVLLGRGLFVQDEAFVIGYTMGTSERIGGFEKEFFKFCAHHFYPPSYRFNRKDLAVYDLGFAAGQANRIEIFNVDLESMMDEKLGALRTRLGIPITLLRHLYGVERCLSTTMASQGIAAFNASNSSVSDKGV